MLRGYPFFIPIKDLHIILRSGTGHSFAFKWENMSAYEQYNLLYSQVL